MIPGWLHGLSIAYLSLGALAAMTIAADEIKHPQHMWIMNVVWPVTALFLVLTFPTLRRVVRMAKDVLRTRQTDLRCRK